jgi:hypothetical protein
MNRNLHRCHVPVTTRAGVQIGVAYQPKPRPLGSAEVAIQSALLDPRTARPLTTMQRLFGALWRLA